jgi:hypothetical protein
MNIGAPSAETAVVTALRMARLRASGSPICPSVAASHRRTSPSYPAPATTARPPGSVAVVTAQMVHACSPAVGGYASPGSRS